MNPEGRVVILTGATQGIGQATAKVLAKAGCKLVLAARSAEALHELTAVLSHAGHQVIAVPTDIGEPQLASALAHKSVEVFGRLDAVINNAAIGIRDRVEDLNETDVRRVMDVNFFGPLALIQAAIPYLRANSEGGLIINVSSIVGRRAVPGIAGYCASKAALEKMAESLRLELISDNVRVSTVYPGVTATRFNSNSLGQGRAGRGRVGGVPPERVARAILNTVHYEGRDVYVTLIDRLFLTASVAWPWLMDRLLRIYLGQR